MLSEEEISNILFFRDNRFKIVDETDWENDQKSIIYIKDGEFNCCCLAREFNEEEGDYTYTHKSTTVVKRIAVKENNKRITKWVKK